MAEKNRELYYNDLLSRNKKLYQKSKDGCKFKKLMDRIQHPDNIMMAFRLLKNNKGSETPSLDGKTIKDLKKLSCAEIIAEVHKRLEYYNPEVVKRVFIPKANGQMRPLGIPSIWDRLIQQCILQVLEPIFEAKFHHRSYGFRPERSAEHAIADIAFKVNRQHLTCIVNVDIHHFFDEVNHVILLQILRKQGILDDKLLMIIKSMLKSEIVFPDGHREMCTAGVPQGGILSPLLANVYLNELDWWISNQWETFETEKDYVRIRDDEIIDRSGLYRALRSTNLKEMYIIRYADDFKIVTDTKENAEKIMYAVKLWLFDTLRLTVSDEKSYICDLKDSSCDFLGFTLKLMKKGRKKNGQQRYVLDSHVSEKAIHRIHDMLSDQIKSMQKAGNSKGAINALIRYNSMVIGIHNYYSIAVNCNNDFNTLGASIQKKLYNHLVRNNDAKRGGTKNFQRHGVYNGDDERYKKYMKSQTVRFYRNYPILPIGYIQHRNPMMKKRGFIYDGDVMANVLKCETNNLRKSAQMNTSKSVEFGCNKITKYVLQNGKCAVTGRFMLASETQGHHINLYSETHDDSYKNIIVVSEDVHKLIHAVDMNIIQMYMTKLHLDDGMVNKINEYRMNIHLQPIF